MKASDKITRGKTTYLILEVREVNDATGTDTAFMALAVDKYHNKITFLLDRDMRIISDMSGHPDNVLDGDVRPYRGPGRRSR